MHRGTKVLVAATSAVFLSACGDAGEPREENVASTSAATTTQIVDYDGTFTLSWSVNPGPNQGGYANLLQRFNGGAWTTIWGTGLGAQSRTVTVTQYGTYEYKVSYAYMPANPCGQQYCVPGLVYGSQTLSTVHFVAPSAYAPPHAEQNELRHTQGLPSSNGSTLWDMGASGAGRKILIFHGGVRGTHQEFSGKLTCHNALMTGGPAAQTTDGCSDGHDAPGSGTLMASVAAANGTDGVSGGNMIGYAPDASIDSVRYRFPHVSASGSYDFQSLVSNSALWATSDVIAISSGFHYFDTVTLDNSAHRNRVCGAMESFVAAGKIVVMAAGGDNQNFDASPCLFNCNLYPQRCKLTTAHPQRMILVGSSNANFTARADFSGYGSLIDLYAPGVSIYGASKAGNAAYETGVNGTAVSTAAVAGAVAQFLSCGVAVDQVKSALTGSASVMIAQPSGGPKPALNVRTALQSIPNTCVQGGSP